MEYKNINPVNIIKHDIKDSNVVDKYQEKLDYNPMQNTMKRSEVNNTVTSLERKDRIFLQDSKIMEKFEFNENVSECF